MEGNLRFKIDWASLIVGRKITKKFTGNFQVQAPGGLIFGGGDLTEGFFIFGGAYSWRGVFSEFYDILYILTSRKRDRND